MEYEAEGNVGTVVEQFMAKEIAPPIAPSAQLEEVERLKIENMYLRLQNLMHQVQQLDQTKAAAVEEMRKIQADMESYRAELSEKYRCDISRGTVTAEGVIHR